MNETGRFFMITGIEWEYGFIAEEVAEGVFNLESDEVALEDPFANAVARSIYKRKDVTEISKAVYDKIMKLHIDSAEEGWGDEEQDALEGIIKEVISAC